MDRGLANNEWRNLFPLTEVQVQEVATSDHLPLFLNLNKRVFEVRQRRFRFENNWVREKECKEIMKRCWQEAENQDLLTKILMCCNELHEWGGSLRREFKQKIWQCRDRLRRLRSRRDGQWIQLYNDVR